MTRVSDSRPLDKFAKTGEDTSEHDDLCSLVAKSADEIFGLFYGNGWSLSELKNADREIVRQHEYILAVRKRCELKLQVAPPPLPLEPIPAFPGLDAVDVIWEYPIQDNGRVVGFLDVGIKCNVPSLTLDREKHKWDVYAIKLIVGVEVKPTIPSVGALIRQLRMYKMHADRMVLCSPDRRFDDLLYQQGFMNVWDVVKRA